VIADIDVRQANLLDHSKIAMIQKLIDYGCAVIDRLKEPGVCHALLDNGIDTIGSSSNNGCIYERRIALRRQELPSVIDQKIPTSVLDSGERLTPFDFYTQLIGEDPLNARYMPDPGAALIGLTNLEIQVT
jgi:hypothetical protein